MESKEKTLSILFVCHGNICRSPMAEFVMKKAVADAGLLNRVFVFSKATSCEELGNGPYPSALRKLREMGVPVDKNHRASQIVRADYEKYDYIIGMDSANMHNMLRIFEGDTQKKLFKLRSFGPYGGDIADPWYTDDFDTTYNQILEGCTGLLKKIKEELVP